MLKILAAADIHLGMKYAGYPEVQEKLAEARFQTLERLVAQANEQRCALFLIAGDLFDRLSVSAPDVGRAVSFLNAFEGALVAVLPGNHDFYTGTSSPLWSGFREAAGDRVLLLDRPRRYDLRHYDLPVDLYAGPCGSKYGRSSAVSWLTGRPPATPPQKIEAQPEGLRIGVAHGSVEGLSPDAQGLYFPMKRRELEGAGLDLWIVGHTHRQHPEAPSHPVAVPRGGLLVPGTPEPDGFDCRHAGTAWLVEADLGRADRPVRARSLSTGTFRFIREQFTVRSAEDIERLERRSHREGLERTLLRLSVNGRLPSGLLQELRRVAAEAEQRPLWVRVDLDTVAEEIGPETVDAEFAEGSFPHRLLKRLIELEDHDAVQAAYELIQEASR